MREKATSAEESMKSTISVIWSSFNRIFRRLGSCWTDSHARVIAVFLIVTFGLKGISSLKGIQDGAEALHPPDCVCTHRRSRVISQTIHEKCLEKGGAPFFTLYLRPRGCKDHTKEQEYKSLKADGWGLIPHCQGHFEIKDGRMIQTKGSLTCVVAPWGPTVTDPPLCCVFQMGGGEVQTGAAGVHRGVHAAGDVDSNAREHWCAPQMCVRYHKPGYRPPESGIVRKWILRISLETVS